MSGFYPIDAGKKGKGCILRPLKGKIRIAQEEIICCETVKMGGKGDGDGELPSSVAAG
jgi:hypothetical protein